jgi:hypothetical protein
MAIPDPVTLDIGNRIKLALEAINKTVGTDFHFPATSIEWVGGISPRWFENPEWESQYWIVVPHESAQPDTAFNYISILEVFVVGAHKGKWSDDPRANAKITPTKESVQHKIAADIKLAVLKLFRTIVSDPDVTDSVINIDLTDMKFEFEEWPSFAIVSSRWEIEFQWQSTRP